MCYDGNKTYQKNITYIKKHKVCKRMFRIKVWNDYVDVTEDHSIMIIRNGILQSIKAKDLINGDKIIWNR